MSEHHYRNHLEPPSGMENVPKWHLETFSKCTHARISEGSLYVWILSEEERAAGNDGIHSSETSLCGTLNFKFFISSIPCSFNYTFVLNFSGYQKDTDKNASILIIIIMFLGTKTNETEFSLFVDVEMEWTMW